MSKSKDVGYPESTTAASHQPCERTLDDPVPQLNLKAILALQTTHDFGSKVEISCLVQQTAPVISGIAKQVFNPGPRLDDGIKSIHCVSDYR